MFLTRAELKPEALRLTGIQEKMVAGGGAHSLVWSLFSDAKDRERDFLWRQEGDGLGTRFFLLSAREPRDPLGIWKFEHQRFEPTFAAGDRLRFSVRVSPVVSKLNEADLAKGVRRGNRHDVVMDAKRAARAAGGPPAPEADLVQRSVFGWLQKRSEGHGFAIAPEALRAERYRQHRLKRKPEKGAEAAFSTVDLDGALTVTDPDRFVALLRTGLGPEKAFGCGLVLVRRI